MIAYVCFPPPFVTASPRLRCAGNGRAANGPIADDGNRVQNGAMKLLPCLIVGLAMTMSACAPSQISGRDKCTTEAIGKETGAGSLKATLSVPERYVSAAEISNGGISAEWEECDYPLNAFFSHETAASIIEKAPTNTLTNSDHGVRLVDAELSIRKFSDGSGKPRFFVTGVQKMSPIEAPRNRSERQYFQIP